MCFSTGQRFSIFIVVFLIGVRQPALAASPRLLQFDVDINPSLSDLTAKRKLIALYLTDQLAKRPGIEVLDAAGAKTGFIDLWLETHIEPVDQDCTLSLHIRKARGGSLISSVIERTPCDLDSVLTTIERATKTLWPVQSYKPTDSSTEPRFAEPLLANLRVVVTPDTATVLVDGKPRPAVNAEVFVKGLAPGEHEVRAVHQDYESRQEKILVMSGESHELHWLLEPKPGRLRISSSPTGARILIDNAARGGETPRTLLLKPGAYRITLQKNGYRSATANITIEPNRTTDLTISLVALPSSTRKALFYGGLVLTGLSVVAGVYGSVAARNARTEYALPNQNQAHYDAANMKVRRGNRIVYGSWAGAATGLTVATITWAIE